MALMVKDAVGATQSVETLPAKGEAAAVASLPVALATEHLALLGKAAKQDAIKVSVDAVVTALGATLLVKGPAALGATSAALAGTTSATATLGPFTPQLARSIWLTLSGAWTGSAQLLRSTDAGVTKLPLTIAGQPWGAFTANANEPVGEETCAGATYYLAVTLTTGTLTYRVAQ